MSAVFFNLNEVVQKLTPEDQEKVLDFAEFLLSKNGEKRPVHQPTFSWAGRIKDLRDRCTSVELQGKALDWRGD